MLGVEAHPIRVEVDLAVGLSNFTIVGKALWPGSSPSHATGSACG